MIKIKWFRGQWLHITFGKTLMYAVMLVMVAFTSLPLVFLVNTAFKPMEELFLFPPRFFVMRPVLTNFTDLVFVVSSAAVPFTRFFFNSLFVTVSIVFLTVMVSSLGAYALVKFKPPGAALIFSIVIMALMFSPHVTRIPTYMVVNSLGLINTYWALILPNIAVAFNIFLMKQFMEQYPDELIEAARIDGAREFRIFWSLVMPSMAPAWSTLIVFTFVTNWNDFFSPLIYVTSQAMRTLPLALQVIGGGPAGMTVGRAGAVAAATLLMTMPTVIIFTIMQGKVMETMVHSGIKG